MKNKIQKLLKSGMEIIKNNKLITVIILISLLFIYFWVIRPYQVRKECSTVTKTSDSYQYINSEYNMTKERQKQKMLVDYIDCRNNNLAEGDQFYTKQEGNNPYSLTQEQYNTLPVDGLVRYIEFMRSINSSTATTGGSKDSLTKNFNPAIANEIFSTEKDDLEKLDQYALGSASSAMFYVYNGYIIDIPTYDTLKENKDKYPQCIFPDDFTQKELWGGGEKYTTDASDTEYKSCLRNHGLDN